MFVAGSVLALMFSGLAVDTFVAQDDETDDNANDDLNGQDDYEDVTGTTSSALEDLLFGGPEAGGEDQAEAPADLLGAEPAPQPEAAPQQDLGDPMGDEQAADDDWLAAAAAAPVGDFVDVEALTILEDGSEIPYVEVFEPETDRLVLEFDGLDAEAPVIEIDHETETDAALVFANGLPVTLIEGAHDMTVEHVNVVMSGEPVQTIDELSAKQDMAATPNGTMVGSVAPEAAGGMAALGAAAKAVADDAPQIAPQFKPDPDVGPQILSEVKDEAVITPQVLETIKEAGAESPQVMPATKEADTEAPQVLFGGASGMDATDNQMALHGTDESDTLVGQASDDLLAGRAGADVLDGGAGDDTLLGNDDADADVLRGGAGNDQIVLGAGDIAEGGEGADTFVADGYDEASDGVGVVNDFDPQADSIEVVYDPAYNPDPTITVSDYNDGSGADILLDGELILSVVGAQGLQPSMVDLRPMA